MSVSQGQFPEIILVLFSLLGYLFSLYFMFAFKMHFFKLFMYYKLSGNNKKNKNKNKSDHILGGQYKNLLEHLPFKSMYLKSVDTRVHTYVERTPVGLFLGCGSAFQSTQVPICLSGDMLH